MYNIYTPQQSCIWSLKPVLRGDFFQLGEGGGSSYNQGIRGGKGVVGSRYFGEESHFLFNTKLKWPWKLCESCIFLLVFEKCWRTLTLESSNGTEKTSYNLLHTAQASGWRGLGQRLWLHLNPATVTSRATFQSASPQDINPPHITDGAAPPRGRARGHAVSQNSL